MMKLWLKQKTVASVMETGRGTVMADTLSALAPFPPFRPCVPWESHEFNKINSYIQIDHFNGDIILSNNYKKFEANIILML